MKIRFPAPPNIAVQIRVQFIRLLGPGAPPPELVDQLVSELERVEGAMRARAAERRRYDAAKHTERCRERHAAFEAWCQVWPNHCRSCLGAGETTYSEDPGARDCSLAGGSMEFSDPCECVENDRCPRCGLDSLGHLWRHPERHLARLSRRAGPRLANAAESLTHRWIAAGMSLGQVSPLGLKAAAWRFHWPVKFGTTKISEAFHVVADWLHAFPDDGSLPGCDRCGWSGKNPGDVAPYFECECWIEEAAADAAAYAVERVAIAVSDPVCFICEEPFSDEAPAVDVSLAMFGTRPIHERCRPAGY